MTPSAPRIRRLSRDMVNKIAAGEVVERPASVIKELVENALDAEAARVEIALEEGGRKLIRVLDDGVGMAPDDLLMAFEPHATSKIASVDDLFNIRTLGFRGEALASIGAVSHSRAVSRERGASEGAEIVCDAGALGAVRASGAPEGTLIEVRDLFFNTPARLKFLRATATELRHIVEMVTRLALPHPAVAFTLTHNDRPVLKLPSCAAPRERLGGLFGDAVAARLLPVQSESSGMILSGFISPPGEGEPTAIQYVFLNGRYIRDRAIQRAIAEAYRSRLLRHRFPAACLNLEMDPARVDVNVHPTKVEVRFRDSGAVFAQVMTTLERTLAASGPRPGQPTAEERREQVTQAVTEFLEKNAGRPEPPKPFLRPQHPTPRTANLPLPPPAAQEAPESPSEQTAVLHVEAAPPPPAAVHPAPAGAQERRCFQIHDSYLVEETAAGFLLIDQHALHERILYEELRARIRQASVPRQRLLIPETVDLRPPDYLLALEMQDLLLRMGLEVEAFGEKTVAIHAVPHLATGVPARDLLDEILRQAAEGAPGQPSDREERVMRSIACKAAVKAGERLSPARIEALLDRRDKIGPEPTCPHGRPTTLRFDLREMEKQFKRK